ncbi:MAG: EndoU domain-containing protein [Bifidobacterium sp.]|nr:EndoU domain-containing protein [Bifidobacterium sp.]
MALTSEGAVLTDRHRRSQVRLAITADSQARRLWDSSLNLADLDASQPVWKQTMLNLLETWYHISQQEALLYLPQFRQAELEGGSGIRVAVPRFDRDAVGGQLDWMGSTNVKWHLSMGQTQQDAYEAARRLFLGAFHEAVLAGGRGTVQEWARKDPRAIGYRRVADGNPCTFCAMLVGRGPVYTSERKALSQRGGGAYHPHCGCTVEVVYGDWKPNGQERRFVDDYYRAAESLPKGEPRTYDRILPIMRRQGAYRDSPSSTGTSQAMQRRAENGWMRKIRSLDGGSRPMPGSWPGNTAPLSRQSQDHILHGDPVHKKGGHQYGSGINGKTEFPKDWDGQRIITEIGRVMADPDWAKKGETSRSLWRFGKTVDGVQIEVRAYRRDGRFFIDHAYPAGGKGVTRVTENGRMAAGPSRGKFWREAQK